jgi:hypothetical protein
MGGDHITCVGCLGRENGTHMHCSVYYAHTSLFGSFFACISLSSFLTSVLISHMHGSREREWYACIYILLLNMVSGLKIAL